MVELVFLGTTAGIPTRTRAHSAIHVRYRGRREYCYLFDCGEGVQRQLLLANINHLKIGAIFITHWHADHYLGLPGLVDTMGFESRTEPLLIFSPEPERVRALLAVGYAQPPFPVSVRAADSLRSESSTLLETQEFLISSLPVVHTVPAVGYVFREKDRVGIDRDKLRAMGLPLASPMYRDARANGFLRSKAGDIPWKQISSRKKGKKVVYSGDTAVCDTLRTAIEEADLLVHDCTFFENVEGNYGHTSLGELLAMTHSTSVKRIVLTHISRRYQNHEALDAMVRDYPNMLVAYDFMKVVV